ncbi:hypothetical protein BY996DRAFT_4552745, partial [Phakopsora pachyrhizi]
GYSLNKILKDIINCYKLLLGFCINYKPEFDCHSLPLKIKVFARSPIAICNEARKTAEEGFKLQTEEFKRLCVFSDWDKA